MTPKNVQNAGPKIVILKIFQFEDPFGQVQIPWTIYITFPFFLLPERSLERKRGIASHETLEVSGKSFQKAKHSQCHINISVTETSMEMSLIETSRPQATLGITTLEEVPEQAEMDHNCPSHSMTGK